MFDGESEQRRVTIGTPPVPGTVLLRVEPWTPAPSDLQVFAGAYRSDEIEPVYRLTIKDNNLRLERLKSAPATLEPLVTDTFRAPFGFLRFTRNAAGAVDGFILDGGRIRGMKFWKEAPSTRPSSVAQEIRRSGDH